MNDNADNTMMALGECPKCGSELERADKCSHCNHEMDDSRIGTILRGKYRIDSVLGTGGMGKVYKAIHLEMGEPVAVKFLLGIYSQMANLRERFKREAQALAKLRHPGIVSVLDFGEDASELFMVMELVEGTPLADIIHLEGQPLSLLRIGEIFDQILQVLEAAHAKGIVHRDMKPENVMLVSLGDRREYVKILDFGLALIESKEKTEKRLTEVGSIQGTPHYMSPEQCRGTEVGPPTDIYAVGAMLFEALAGTPPFDATEMAGLMAQQMFVEPPRVRDKGWGRDVSIGVEKVVARALAKRAEDRFAASEFRDALLAALKGTDSDALIARAAEERVMFSGLTREDRALTGINAKANTSFAPAPLSAAWRVLLWMDDSDEFREIRDTLAVNGMRVTHWKEGGELSTQVEEDSVKCIVLSAKGVKASSGDELPAPLLLHSLKQNIDTAQVPVLVIGVEDGSQIANFVRVGANDVALANIGGDEVARKVRRLVKRGR